MKVVIQDANVLIDLEQAGLLRRWFELGIETWTTDLILHQVSVRLQPEVHRVVEEGLLKIRTTNGPQLERLYKLQSEVSRGLEIEDVSALFWSARMGAVLLTGDRLLTREARMRSITVHGSLWVMDTLVRRQVVTPHDAATGLQALLEAGRRLPVNECQLRLRKWGG